MKLGGIKAGLIPPAIGLEATLSQVGISCSGAWNYKWGPFHGGGTVDAVVDKSQIELGLELIPGSDGLVDTAHTKKCVSGIAIAHLEFHGGISWIINIFKGLIASYTETQLNELACTQITTLINTNLTEFVRGINEDIRPYIKPPPPPAPPKVPPGMVNLSSNAIVDLVDYTFDSIVGIDGPLGIKKLANLLTDNTGNWVGVFNDTLQYTVSLDFANATFGLNQLSLSGLNTANLFDILRPVNSYSLTSATGMDYLGIGALFYVNVSLNSALVKSATLFERGNLTAVLREAQLNTTFQLALNETTVNSLLSAPAKLGVATCLLDALYNFNATQAVFNMSVDKLELAAIEGDIEKQFDEALTTILSLFTTAYVKVIPAFFNGMIAGPLRNYGNEWFANLTERHSNGTCPEMAIPQARVIPDGMVSFVDNPVLQVVDFSLNEIIGTNGPLGINTIINEWTNQSGRLDFAMNFNFTTPVWILGNLSFGVTELSVLGLNSFSQVGLLKPEKEHMLNSTLRLDELQLLAKTYVRVESGGIPLEEPISFGLKLNQTRLNVTLQVALNQSLLNGLLEEPEQMIQVGCLIGSLFDLNSTFSSIDLSCLELTVIPHMVPKPFQETATEMVSVLLNGVVGGPVREYANGVITNLIDTMKQNSSCVPVPIPAVNVIPPGMANFTGNPLISVGQYLTNDIVGTDGPIGLNKVMNMLTAASGELKFHLNKNFSFPIVGTAALEFGLTGWMVSGLTTWDKVDLLEPITAQQLANHLGLGEFGLSLNYWLKISFNPESYLYQTGNVSFDMTDNRIDMSFLLSLSESELTRLISTPNEIIPVCLLKTFHDAYIHDMGFNFNLTDFALFTSETGHAFGSSLQELMSTLVNSALQKPVRKLANDWITTNLQYYAEKCQPVPPAPIPGVPEGSIDLKNNNFVGLLEYLMDDLIGIDGPFSINEIMNRLTDNTGVFKHDLNLEYNQNFLIGDLTVHLVNGTISGLNTWASFAPIRRNGNYTLDTDMVLQALELELNLWVKIQLFDGSDPSYKNTTLLLTLHNNSMQVTTQLALNETRVDALSVIPEEWAQMACLAEPINNLALANTSLGFSLKQFQVVIVGEEDWDFSTFGAGLAALVNSTVYGPLRTYANGWIIEKLEAYNSTCVPPSHPVHPQNGTVDLRDNPVVELIDYLAGDVRFHSPVTIFFSV